MRKTKFLALVLVVAVMLMGVGYAAWTEKITVDTTVKTGDMDVNIVDVHGTYYVNHYDENNNPDTTGYSYWYSIPNQNVPNPFGFTNPIGNVTDADNRVAMNYVNIIPGSECETVVFLQNASTHPIALNEIKVKHTGPNKMKNMMSFTVTADFNINGTNVNTQLGEFFLNDPNWEADLETALGNVATDKLVIGTGAADEGKITFVYKMDPDALNNTQELSNFASVCHFEFIQSNCAEGTFAVD